MAEDLADSGGGDVHLMLLLPMRRERGGGTDCVKSLDSGDETTLSEHRAL